MKNDTKMKNYFNALWNQYSDTKITEKDNYKAIEQSKTIFDLSLAGYDLNEEKSKFIKANNE